MLGGEQSGFIIEIGLELFQKILDEAIRELRTTEYAELYADQPLDPPATEVLLDTDAPALLPDFYVRNTTERLSLYRELDDLESEDALDAFENRLTDRFGPLPEQAQLLLALMRLRMQGGRLGLEKNDLAQRNVQSASTRRQSARLLPRPCFWGRLAGGTRKAWELGLASTGFNRADGLSAQGHSRISLQDVA